MAHCFENVFKLMLQNGFVCQNIFKVFKTGFGPCPNLKMVFINLEKDHRSKIEVKNIFKRLKMAKVPDSVDRVVDRT